MKKIIALVLVLVMALGIVACAPATTTPTPTTGGTTNTGTDLSGTYDITMWVSEIDGVAGLSNTVGSEIYDFIGRKSVTKGIKVSFAENTVTIDATIMVHFGVTIATIAGKVQSAVANSIEAMTGMSPVVNIRVAGISFEK